MKNEYSVLIGGQAGDGVKQGGNSIARLLNRLGYYIFVYEDYPSIIRGGHNFGIIRASSDKIAAHSDKIDILVALNQDTVEKHKDRLNKDSLIIFDSSQVKSEGLGIPLSEIVKNKELPPIVRNIGSLGALACALGIDFSVVEDTIKNSIGKKVEENISVAKEVYDIANKESGNKFKIQRLDNESKPIITGNEAIALGSVKGGLKLYIAYPMTPASSVLHYLAKHEDELNIKTVHPENEIAVIGMAQGASYAGVKNMVGTSGGGFALMTEHISLAGQAEIPTVIVLSQRTGPATGVPTYTEQGDLNFAINAGQGEFPKIVLAPGDLEEAFYLAAESMNLAWKYQIPVILLSDKHLSEGYYSSEIDESKVKIEGSNLWNKEGDYKRYKNTEDGISPMAFPGENNAINKTSSYEADEFGMTIEEADLVISGQEKRLKKIKLIENDLKDKKTVNVLGNKESDIALIAWGSSKGAAEEIAKKLNLKVIQPLYMHPFPIWEIKKHLEGVKKIIGAETNSLGQLCDLLESKGIKVNERILRYDGRPFTIDGLEKEVKKYI